MAATLPVLYVVNYDTGENNGYERNILWGLSTSINKGDEVTYQNNPLWQILISNQL